MKCDKNGKPIECNFTFVTQSTLLIHYVIAGKHTFNEFHYIFGCEIQENRIIHFNPNLNKKYMYCIISIEIIIYKIYEYHYY